MRQLKAKKSDSGVRLDVFIASRYPAFTRSSLARLFKEGLVLVDKIVAKPAHKLRINEVVLVDERYLNEQPPEIELPIIYEDENVVVIDKPEGVLSHSKGALNLEATVASFIKSKITDKTLTSNRAGIVHRLDRATSGVMITAKNTATLSRLQKQFSQAKTKKQYLAIVEGDLEPKDAIIDAPISRNPAHPQTFKVSPSGKQSVTVYKTIKSFSKNSKRYTKVLLLPKTGRTHQLRVHLAYINHPIVGDNVYGRGDGHLLLHAQSLELTLPGGQRRVFTSQPPDRIKDFLDV